MSALARELTRISTPTAATFVDDFLRPRRPVLIERAAATWPALTRWTTDYLRTQLGEQRTRIRRAQPREAPVTPTDWSSFLDLCATQPDGSVYLPGYDIDTAGVNRLSTDFARPDFVPHLTSLKDYRATLFAGWQTRGNGHYHPFHQAILAQVIGRKRFRLYAPGELRHLYLKPVHSLFAHHTRVNLSSPDAEGRWPRVARARYWEGTLEPGDLLYVPPHYLHVFDGVEWSVSLTFFWRAAAREWTFPTPGVRTLLSVPFGAARLLWSHLKPDSQRPLPHGFGPREQ